MIVDIMSLPLAGPLTGNELIAIDGVGPIGAFVTMQVTLNTLVVLISGLYQVQGQ